MPNPTATDGKYGTITAEKGDFHEGEPVVLFRAQDELLPMILKDYAELAEAAGSPPDHLAKILQSRQEVLAWQDAHGELTKIPD